MTPPGGPEADPSAEPPAEAMSGPADRMTGGAPSPGGPDI